MEQETRKCLLKRLDEAALGFRLGRTAAGEMAGWVRSLRQMLEIPVDEFAGKLGVSRREIFRLEKSEEESRIQLGTLRRAAEALDCDKQEDSIGNGEPELGKRIVQISRAMKDDLHQDKSEKNQHRGKQRIPADSDFAGSELP